MEDLLIHILKSAGLGSMFIILYLLLLRNDTSFGLNRKFLFAGMITSIILPWVEITRYITLKTSTENITSLVIPSGATSASDPGHILSAWDILTIIYFLGLGFLFVRFLIELFSLWRSTRGLNRNRKDSFVFLTSKKPIKPFSFFHYIIYNPQEHSEEELRLILSHEKAHARQWHSIDVLFANLFCMLLWFNPFSWLYKKSIIENLEFLADREAMIDSFSKKEYQKTLLRVSVGDYRPVLTNQFFQSFIKKRIKMLNSETPKKQSFIKAGLILPFIFLFMISFNVKTVAQIAEPGNEQISVNEISVTITGTESKKELSGMSKYFNKNGIELEFDNLEYSGDRLTGIQVQINNSKTGERGKYNLNSSAGIDPFVIYSGKDGTGFKSISGNSGIPINIYSFTPVANTSTNGTGQANINRVTTTLVSSVSYKDDGTTTWQTSPPFYVVEGKIKDQDFDVNSIDPKMIKSISVLEGKSATEKYGEKAELGAIEIDLKSPEELAEEKEKKIDRQETDEALNISIHTMDSGNSDNAKVSIELNSDGNFNLNTTDALIVVNGKVKKSGFDLDEADLEKIKTVNVLKGKSAIEKYGDKAAKGVIEITTEK